MTTSTTETEASAPIIRIGQYTTNQVDIRYDELLVEHAARLVWCSPYEDEQYIIELAQLTDRDGSISEVEIFGSNLRLPHRTIPYHLYMLGANHPITFNLPVRINEWIPMTEWVNKVDFTFKMYNQKGILIPHGLIYFYLECDGNILLAIEQPVPNGAGEPFPVEVGVEKIYIHFRSPQYYVGLNTPFSPTAPEAEDPYKTAEEKDRTASFTQLAKRVVNYDSSNALPGQFIAHFRRERMKFQKDIRHSTMTLKTQEKHQNRLEEITEYNRVDCNYYYRGMPYNTPAPSAVGLNYHEIITDDSIIFTQYHRLSDLKTFQSRIDNCNKYLLCLYDTKDMMEIHYRDDVEIHLIYVFDSETTVVNKCKLKYAPEELAALFPEGYDKTDNFSKKYYNDKFQTTMMLDGTIMAGCYYHRNRENSLRHVTHRAYSLPVDYVLTMIQEIRQLYPATHFVNQDNGGDYRNWWLKVQVRKAGIERNLIAERHHVYALDCLSWPDRLRAMTDTASNVPIWRAENLEESSYNYLMRCYRHELTPMRILDAYGYNQTVLAIANPNVSITKSKTQPYFVLPAGLIENSTIYEYDQEGLLLGWYHHLSHSSRYVPVNENAIFIEAYAGLGSRYPGHITNPTQIEIDPLINYRFYAAPLDREVIIGPFEDVTENRKYVQQDDRYYTAIHDPSVTMMIAIPDDKFLARDLYLQRPHKGVYEFSLTHGNRNDWLLIPPGKLAVWVNGKALIENIDYFVDFPKVTIVSKEKLDVQENEGIKVTYRCLGYCSTEMKIRPARETGFVIANTISMDGHYDIHANKISRITIGSGVVNPHVIEFDRHSGEATVPVSNGTPYCIDDQYVSLRGFAGYGTYRLDIEEQENTKRINEYLTIHNKPRKAPQITTLKDRYHVYSPFMAAVIHAMDGTTKWRDISYKDRTAIDRFVKPYKYLLAMDPAAQGADNGFIEIHPLPYHHNGSKEVHHRYYRLLEQIAKIYLKERVELNEWFYVKRTREDL